MAPSIPVWEADLPDYSCPDADPASAPDQVPGYGVRIPGDYLRLMPDMAQVGRAVDDCLDRELAGRHVALQALSIAGHPRPTVDELIGVITEFGHDRHDGERHDADAACVGREHADICGRPFTIRPGCRYMPAFLEPAYYVGLAERGHADRIDLLVAYDRAQLRLMRPRGEGREQTDEDGFTFRFPERMPQALLGIVRTLLPG